MLDVITLQARGQYKQDEYLQQAAHERLLRQLRPAVTHAPVGRPAHISQRGPLLVAALATTLLLGLGLRLAAAPAEAAPTASVTTTTAASTLTPSTGSGCWITGDLVGEANPAVIAAALCGQ